MSSILCLYSTLGVGGAERQLALLLPRLREHGFDPYVATLRHRGAHFEALDREGIATRFVGMRSRADVLGIARAYSLWRLRPDLVFTSSVDAQVIGHFVALRAGAPHVTVEHAGARLPRALHRRLLLRTVAPHIDSVVAVSATQCAELQRSGYRPERITVIPNGIPEPSPLRPRHVVRADLGIADDDVLALLVATLRPEKRADLFVAALHRAQAREPRLRGVVAGGGPQLARVRALAGTRPGVVQVLGERNDSADLIHAADVVCLTSAFEALPITVLEAMALARPVVAMGVGGIPDAIEDRRTGRLVPPGDLDAFVDALVYVARAPLERRALGDAARCTYEHRYTLDRMVADYVKLLSTRPGAGTLAAANRELR